jgi:Peptidase family M28
MLQLSSRSLSIGLIALCFPVLHPMASGQMSAPIAPPEDLKTGFESITPEQAELWLKTLAGPGFAGRGTGQAGYMKAAHWVAGKVAEFGLEPVGNDGTYFQLMPLTSRGADLAACKLTGPDGFELTVDGNLGFDRFSGEAEIEGEAVFVTFSGEPLALPEGINLRDKVIVWKADDSVTARAARLIAMARPAASLRVVPGAPATNPQTLFPGRRTRSTGLSGTIRESAAMEMAAALGAGEFPAQAGEGATGAETGKKIRLEILFRDEVTGAPNVCAFLEGSDPALKHEYVVIGAHLDHLGQRGDEIYPGADDNGSGSTAILSIARAMALNPVKPQRSVLFIWFTAEEVGLVGSGYYVSNPRLPLENMICMFNIDMVGRNEDQGTGDAAADNEGHIHLVGSQRGDNALHELILRANQHTALTFEFDEEGVWNRSDQINFYNAGVPVAFLFGGFHPDYHQTGDKPEKINFTKVATAAKLFYVSVFFAAEHGRFAPNPGPDPREKEPEKKGENRSDKSSGGNVE